MRVCLPRGVSSARWLVGVTTLVCAGGARGEERGREGEEEAWKKCGWAVAASVSRG